MLSYFLMFIAFLILIGLVGTSTLLVVRRKLILSFSESVLISLFTGYIISITIFSLVHTGFKSVNLLYIFLLLFALWEIARMPLCIKTSYAKIDFKLVPILFGIASILFGITFFSVYNPASFIPFNYNNNDYILYAKIAKYISLTGEENGFNVLNQLDAYYKGPEPYHFFDLWGAAMANYVFGINHYLALRIIVYPTFYFLFFIGAFCLFKESNRINALLTLFIIWFGGLYLPVLHGIPFLKDLNSITANIFSIGLYKLSYFYAFIICSYLIYRKTHWGLALICFLGLPVANIITAPTLVVALFLLSCFAFAKGLFGRERLYINITYLILFSILLVFFYSLLKTERAGLAGAEITSPFALLQDSFSISNLGIQINILIGSIIYLLVLYFPVIPLLLKSFFQNLLDIFALIVIMATILVSLLIWAVLFYELNSSQVFYNITTSIINVGAVILIITSINNGLLSLKPRASLTWVLSSLIIITILTNIVNTFNSINTASRQIHSNNFLEKVSEAVQENELVATLKSSSDIQDMFSKYNAVYPLGNYLFLTNKNVGTVNIGDLDTPIDTTSKMNRMRSLKAIRDGLFYRYATLGKNQQLKKDDLVINFLKKYRIRFIIASKNAEQPQALSQHIKSIILDDISGEKFIELSKSFIN